MSNSKFRQIVGLVLLASLAFSTYSCTVASSNEEFFGKPTPPARNIFRYVNGDEPESLDPVVGNGQPEARLYMKASLSTTQKRSRLNPQSPNAGT